MHKIVRINNIPAFLTCIEKNTDSNLTPSSPVPSPIPPPPTPGPRVNLVIGVPDFSIIEKLPPNPFPIGLGISKGTYEKILLANGLTGTYTDASALKNYQFTVNYLPLNAGARTPPLTWTLGGKIFLNGDEIWLNVTSGGYPTIAMIGLGNSSCSKNGFNNTCYTLLFYPPTIPILPHPPNTGPNSLDKISFYAVRTNDSDQTWILVILLSDYKRVLSVNYVNDVSDLTAYSFRGSKDLNVQWMLNGTISHIVSASESDQRTTMIALGVTSGPDEQTPPKPGGYTLTFYPRI